MLVVAGDRARPSRWETGEGIESTFVLGRLALAYELRDRCSAARLGATTLVVGAYPVRGEIGRRLLEALPDVLRVLSCR